VNGVELERESGGGIQSGVFLAEASFGVVWNSAHAHHIVLLSPESYAETPQLYKFMFCSALSLNRLLHLQL